MWVSAAGSILMMKKVATEVQTSQAHMDASIQPRSHPLSAVLDPGAMNSTVHKALTSTQQSCREQREAGLHGASAPQGRLSSSALCLLHCLSLYFCLPLMLTHISTSLLSLPLPLSLSNSQLPLSARSAFAQRMLNMCSGWGLGTAAFLGGTLTSHTARLGRMAL